MIVVEYLWFVLALVDGEELGLWVCMVYCAEQDVFVKALDLSRFLTCAISGLWIPEQGTYGVVS